MPDSLIQFNLLTGLDGRTDPHSQQVGALDQAVNIVFPKTGGVQKRHGNVGQGNLVVCGLQGITPGYPGTPVGGSTLPMNPKGYITRYGEQNIVAGHRLYTYSPGLGVHISKDDYPEAIGTRRPLAISQNAQYSDAETSPGTPGLLSSYTNPDVAVSSDGFTCYVYVDQIRLGAGFAVYDQATSVGPSSGRSPYVFGGTIPAPEADYNPAYPKVIAVGTAFVVVFYGAASDVNNKIYAITIVHGASGWTVGPVTKIATTHNSASNIPFDLLVLGTDFVLLTQANTSGSGAAVQMATLMPDTSTNGTYTVVNSTTFTGGGAGDTINNVCLALNGTELWAFWIMTESPPCATSTLYAAVVTASSYSTLFGAELVTMSSGDPLTNLMSYMAAVAVPSSSSVYLVCWNPVKYPTSVGPGTTPVTVPVPFIVTIVAGNPVATPVPGYTWPVNGGTTVVSSDGQLVPISRPMIVGTKLYLFCWFNSALQGTWFWVDLNVDTPQGLDVETGGANSYAQRGPRIVCALANRLATGVVVEPTSLSSVAIRNGVYISPILVGLGGASRTAPTFTPVMQLWEASINYSHPNLALGCTLGRETIANTSVYDGQLITELGFYTYPEGYTGGATGPQTGTQAGASASINVSGDVMTVTGLTDIPANLAGSTMTITGASHSDNNGTYTVASVISNIEVTLINDTPGTPGADPNNGSINWFWGLSQNSAYQYALVWEWLTNAGELVQSTTQASATGQVLTIMTGTGNNIVELSMSPFLSTAKTDFEVQYNGPPTLAIYRTQAGGSTFTRVTSLGVYDAAIAQYPTSYVDGATDQQIAGNQELYFAPGSPGTVLDNVSPPSFAHTITALGAIWGIGDDLRTVWVSKPYVEGFQPGFNEDLTTTVEDGGDLVALAFLNQNVVLFSQTRIYLTYGQNPGATGTLAPMYVFQPIQTDVGCSNARSAVVFPDGIAFMSQFATGSLGLYVLGQDFTVNYVDAPEQILAQYTNVTSAVLVPEHHEIRFELNNGTNGITLVVNYWAPAAAYKYKVSIFEKYDASGAISNCISTAAGYVNGYRWAAASGYPYAEDTTGTTYMDGGSGEANWVTLLVQTGWIAGNGVVGYQRGKRWAMIGDWYSSADVTLSTQTDYNPSQSGPTGQSTTRDSDAFEGGPLERARVGIQYQKHQAVRFTIQDAYPTGANATVGSGRGFSVAGIALQVVPKPGLKLFPPSRSL
jgi:hypothetical protein